MSGSHQYADEAELEDDQAHDDVGQGDYVDDSQDQSPSPRTGLLSIGNSRETLSLAERPRRFSRRDRDRGRGSTHRELVKLLINEELEIKQTKRALTAALDRLDGETHRAQEAERRALELAQRFRDVNNARIAAQQEANRLQQELTLYKHQYENAQRELLKGQDLLRDIEGQRDDAEAAAARARTTARKLREQQLVSMAREDGRREGFQEGLRRAYEGAGGDGYRSRSADAGDAGAGDVEGGVRNDPVGRTTPLEEFSPEMLNLPSPPQGGIHLAPSITTTLDDPGPSARLPQGAYSGGAQGSRFRENIASPGTSTLASLGPAVSARPGGPAPWPQPPPANASRFARPTVVRSTSPAPGHPEYTVPPDGWIPTAGTDNYIPLPPPHEFHHLPPSPHTPSTALRDMPVESDPSLRHGVTGRDYAHNPKQRASPRSLAESLTSTTMSQFDLLSSPRARAAGRDRGPTLSAIPEVATSVELSPGTEGRARSSAMPEAIVFPTPSPGPQASFTGSGEARRSASRGESYENDSGAGSSRQRRSSRTLQHDLEESISRPAEVLGLSNASVQEWLGRSSADEASLHQSNASRSRHSSQHRQANVADASSARSASPFDRPYSAASGDVSRHRRSRSTNAPSDAGSGLAGHRRIVSSGSMTISVQPPSGPTSSASPSAAMESGRLTPSSTFRSLGPSSSQPYVPTPPSMDNQPVVGEFSAVSELPAGFVPTSPYMQPPSHTPAPPSPGLSRLGMYSGLDPAAVPIPPSSTGASAEIGANSLSSWAPPVRSASRNSNDASRLKTPGFRPPSALGSVPPGSSRPHTPSQPPYIPPGNQPLYVPPANQPLYVPPPNQALYVPEPGMKYPEPSSKPHSARASPNNGAANVPLPSSALGMLSPRSATSRLSGHQRSLSMNAGSTPAATARPLSGAAPPARPQLRRVPSTGSVGSNLSRHSGYSHYDPNGYVDPAFLASSEDLTNVQSPGTMANTRQNATFSAKEAPPGPRSPSALSYQSFNSRA